jgi:hypothetical protein
VIVDGKKITGYESLRFSDLSLVAVTDSIDENHRAYVNFVSSLKSPISRKAYVIRLKNYLRSASISFSTFDEFLSRNPRLIEQGIIKLLIDMHHRKELSCSAQNVFLSTLTLFFSINEVVINRKKIKKFMSESENSDACFFNKVIFIVL